MTHQERSWPAQSAGTGAESVPGASMTTVPYSQPWLHVDHNEIQEFGHARQFPIALPVADPDVHARAVEPGSGPYPDPVLVSTCSIAR